MTIVHTSGSARVPGAVLHTCGNHYYNALGSSVNLPLTAEDRWLLDLPLHHVAGLGIVFRCLLAGVHELWMPTKAANEADTHEHH